MKSVTSLANKAFTAILGQLGAGTAGSVTNNSLAQTNAAPIGPAVAPEWDSSPFVSRTGRVLIMAIATIAPGTLVDGDAVDGQLFRDGTTQVGGTTSIGATTYSVSVRGEVAVAWIDTVTPGSSHTWGIRATVSSGGHTAQILTSNAVIVLIDI